MFSLKKKGKFLFKRQNETLKAKLRIYDLKAF